MNELSEDLLKLTAREIQVMQLVAQGRTSKEIGDVLFIGQRTVEGFKLLINKKLGCRNSAHAVWKCINIGIIA